MSLIFDKWWICMLTNNKPALCIWLYMLCVVNVNHISIQNWSTHISRHTRIEIGWSIPWFYSHISVCSSSCKVILAIQGENCLLEAVLKFLLRNENKNKTLTLLLINLEVDLCGCLYHHWGHIRTSEWQLSSQHDDFSVSVIIPHVSANTHLQGNHKYNDQSLLHDDTLSALQGPDSI